MFCIEEVVLSWLVVVVVVVKVSFLCSVSESNALQSSRSTFLKCQPHFKGQ